MKLKSAIHSGRTFPAVPIALFTWLALMPSLVAAQQITVNLDPAQTRIEWTLGDVLHTVHGTFKLKSGSVTFDPRTADAGGEIIVDATSGESGNNSRDQKMHKEILESKRYPEITFSPRHVTGNVAEQGTSNIQVQGLFHIHGASHEVTLSLPVEKSGDQVRAKDEFRCALSGLGHEEPKHVSAEGGEQGEDRRLGRGPHRGGRYSHSIALNC